MGRKQIVMLLLLVFGSALYVILSQVMLTIGVNVGEPSKPEVRYFCAESYIRTSAFGIQKEDNDTSLIYVITPTYKRPEMVPELTRIGQTLLLVPRVHWIVAEDNVLCTKALSELLLQIGIPFTHLASPMPDNYRRQRYVPRGVSNRRAALEWIRKNGEKGSILYFLDDDNAVDVHLFDEIRETEKVSMWPVGLIGDFSVSSPVIGSDGHVVGFYDGWPAGRKFQVDMAGFAVSVDFFKSQSGATMPYIAGYEEDGFLKSLNVNLHEIEVKADGCTKILVWHTKTTKTPVKTLNLKKHQQGNILRLTHFLRQCGVIK